MLSDADGLAMHADAAPDELHLVSVGVQALRSRAMRSRWGTCERYRRWQSIRARLHRVIGPDDTIRRLLADYDRSP